VGVASRLIVALVVSLGLAAGAPAFAQVNQGTKKSDKLTRLEARLQELQIKGAMHAALPVARQVAELKRKELGADHMEVGWALSALAGLYQGAGDHVQANRIYRELLARAEQKHGPESQEAAMAIEQLAAGAWVAQKLDEAERLYQRSLALRKKLHGEDSPMFATYLQMYAGVLQSRSAYSAAEDAYRRARTILEKADRDNPQLIGTLYGLGWIYLQTGQDRKAKEAFDRALAVSEKSYGAAGGDWVASARAGMLMGVASMYQYAGRDELARPLLARGEKLYKDEIARLEKADPKDPKLSGMLGALAGMHQRAGQLAEAEALYRRAIAIDEQQQHQNPMAGVAWLSSLAMVERDRGRFKEALALFTRMRAIYARQMGEHSAGFMDAMIAEVHRDLGDHRAAEQLLAAMVKRMEKQYGKQHSMVGTYLESLAGIQVAAGAPKRALATLERALAIAEPALATVLAAGTEQDHAAYFHRIAHQLHLAVMLNVRDAPNDARASTLALTTALRRKARILDAAANTVAVLRGKLGKEDQALLDELASARGQLAKLILAGPDGGDPDEYATLVADLEGKVRKLEDQMRRKSADYRAATRPIDLAAVQKAVPDGAALVEIVSYKAYDPKAVGKARWESKRRYAAYVLRRKGPPRLVELGDGDAIDGAARAFLEAVSDPDRDDVGPLGRALHKLTFGKLGGALGGVKRVYLAPDGALNLVPFGALTDDGGKFLVASYELSYLTSGRDLLRPRSTARARGGPVIVADPAFDGGDVATGKQSPAQRGGDGLDRALSRGRRSRDLRGEKWKRLPGTAQEAAALAKVLDRVTRLEGARATEQALKQLRGPRILHIATHGFFLPSEEPPPVERRGPAAVGVVALPSIDTGAENPLLRSGLALAGANQLASGDEDGVLTALEAAGLDLAGTALVVLSACETGVGKATDGDGVHGLRRALVIAGARGLVMSLWQVDDRATRDLMTGFYRRLDSQGASAALRAVQLELAASERYKHPYYWASFVPAGDLRGEQR
jgi:CHAT domain-containing protein/tetratricopeptide (TPR) repeat protein